MSKVSLYQCLNAKVKGDKIYCAKGHSFNKKATDGTIHTRRLQRGTPLELAVCQSCEDYNNMGPPVPAKERGW